MKKIFITAIAAILLSCNSEPSLQKYFVEKTEDKNFIQLDLSPSLLNINKAKLTPDEDKALASFDKMNILAFKNDGKNQAAYEAEKTKISTILKDEKYQQLMKFGQGKDGGSLSFVGDENHIDEFILFANRKENGFAVVRILGKDMSPTSVFTMMSMLKSANIDQAQLKPLTDIIKPQN
ncbi:MAG: DUF4252 domain-containing protein [Flavobacterium sp.]|nr:MAG: DUF4252 domain-containing protein [Flavobacterium sp.]